MMSMADDFRGLPRAEFELTLRHKGCWAGKLSKASGQELAIDPIVQKGKHLIVLVLTPKDGSMDALVKLKRAGEIRDYVKLQEGDTKILFRVEEPGRTSIPRSITDYYFEFLSSFTVKDDIEKYRFGTLDLEHADLKFSELLSELKKMKDVFIIDYQSRKIERAPLIEVPTLTDQDHELVKELITSDYFNPNKKDRPTQEDLAKRLGISTGKLNQMLRKLEHMGFQNLLAVRADLDEFRALLREVERDESE